MLAVFSMNEKVMRKFGCFDANIAFEDMIGIRQEVSDFDRICIKLHLLEIYIMIRIINLFTY